MFNMTFFNKSEIAGTIKVKDFVRRLGPITDVNGCRWDVAAIFGCGGLPKEEQIVCACPMSSLHPYFYDTSMNCNYGVVHQTWEPYLIEKIEEENKNENS